MKEYAVGFAFCREKVALIKKARPAWQAGRLNGIGGHLEPGEGPHVAMVREFKEETGFVDNKPWTYFAMLQTTEPSKIYFFCRTLDSASFQTLRNVDPTEPIWRWEYMSNYDPRMFLGNVPALIHLAVAAIEETMTGFPLIIQESGPTIHRKTTPDGKEKK